MARMPDVEPTVTELKQGGFAGGKLHEHPAYGQIGAYRSTSGGQVLYGSDFRHNTSVTIEISESSFRRDLSRDWPSTGSEIVRLTMSEAQWATFVSSLNCGSGVQCTLEHVMGKRRPGITYRDAAAEHHAEMEDRIADGLRQIAAARAAVAASGLSKAKQDAILAPLNKAEQQITKNAPFVVESHAKAMEQRVEKAKIEVDAYVTGAVMRAGLTAIAEGASPLVLPSPTPPETEPFSQGE